MIFLWYLTLATMKIHNTFSYYYCYLTRYIQKPVLKTDSLLLLMSFSLLVQRKERLVALQRSEKEKTPRVKSFSSFTACFSGIPVLRSNTAKDEAELTCIMHAQTAAIIFP